MFGEESGSDIEKEIKNKLKNGWIKSNIMFELLAVNPENTKEALENHVNKMEKEGGILVCKKDLKEILETTSPFPEIPKAYSGVIEAEILTENLDKLMFIAMNYGPSSIELLEPSKLTIDIGEAQGILTSVYTMMHKFAAAGIGGIVHTTVISDKNKNVDSSKNIETGQ